MKKTIFLLAIMMVFILGSPLCADEIDNSLQVQVSERLKASTREMIQAGVDTEETFGMTRAMIQHRFKEKNIIQAQKIVMKAHQTDTPTAPVISKAYEGLSKKIDEEKVLKAMEKTRSRYAYAYEHARKLSDSEAQIETTGNLLAQSMSAGLTEEDAEVVMSQLKTQKQKRKSLLRNR